MMPLFLCPNCNAKLLLDYTNNNQFDYINYCNCLFKFSQFIKNNQITLLLFSLNDLYVDIYLDCFLHSKCIAVFNKSTNKIYTLPAFNVDLSNLDALYNKFMSYINLY
jgi:hypothetical protein